MFKYLFGYTEVVDSEIQPSYRDVRQRHLVMTQIRSSKIKLKKTFVIDTYKPIGYHTATQYRKVGVKKIIS